ncbi:DUF2087 domain-containing protein [Oleisolibacter albus]|uniref:DUF2087 domain-containing protein n=1 Tax=Oleisolibacter albus TaxID=2171757 RepID=UPI000DF41638|nr:DUF2087 domain-containing protein [Oleisolibacter albus]
MSRTPLPYQAEDISAVARALHRQLAGQERPPGHVELLNMLARAAGYRNVQHLRAQHLARTTLDQPPAAAAPVDYVLVKRLQRYFDDQGRLARWPGKFSHQQPCLWVLWSRIPARTIYNEREISLLIQAEHGFGDHALLRRAMVEDGLLTRTRDCRVYQRVERQPPPESLALIRSLSVRRIG